ncbi:MAG: TolC family protein, partial [Epsilonproteobacteria bacterium]|nr:TolC family protein [Campylobacterota bacterium]
EYDEIAKTELLQLQMEKKRLQTQLENFQRKLQSSKQQLLQLSHSGDNTSFSCHDIYPIRQELTLNENSFSLSKQAHNKRIESTQAGLKRHSKTLDSIELSMGYENELEMDIYSVGIAIPLNFTSNQNEQKRVALMHQSSALNLQNQQNMENKSYKTQKLQSQLTRLFHTIASQEQNINHYQNQLLPLMKKSYDYAQSSVIEYLLNQQRLSTLQQELLNYKKEYYQSLFELYTLSETEEKL